jgi:diguanylate cyclase (GGDEF)-like protein
VSLPVPGKRAGERGWLGASRERRGLPFQTGEDRASAWQEGAAPKNWVSTARSVLEALAEINPDGIVVVGDDDRVLLHNTGACRLLNIHADDLTRQRFTLHRRSSTSHEVEVRSDTGKPLIVQVRVSKVAWFGQPAHLVSLRAASTADPAFDDEARFHDALTGLPTRELFLNRVHERLRAVRATPGVPPPSIARIDLDRFCRVNEFYGQATGDRILQAVANRLTTAVRPGDYVARFGDDDFAILLPPGDPDEHRAVAERVIEALQQPFHLDGRSILCNPTVGLAEHTAGQDAEAFTAAAELALVSDRIHGAGSGEVSVVSGGGADTQAIAMRQSISGDVHEHELVVLYEPRFRLDDNQMVALQAMVRWDHPDDGLVHPPDNARVVDHAGAVVSMGEWAAREVVDQILEWRERRPDAVISRIPITLLPRHLLDSDFRREVLLILARRGVAPGALGLAISEQVLGDRRSRIERVIGEMDGDGFSVELADYGTGVASLTVLQDVAVSTVRLDHLLVERMVDDEQTRRLVEAVTLASHTFGVSVVGEGMETAEQKALLYRLGCDEAQGPLLSRPLNGVEASRFFVSESTPPPSRAQGLLRRATES